jgi:hypothetical protein
MPFAVGIHFTFDLAGWWGTDWLNAALAGLGPSGWAVNRFGLVGDTVRLADAPLLISDERMKDLIAPAKCGVPVRLVSPAGEETIDISQHADDLPDADASIWVTHMDPRQRFFCVEPWIGWPNALNSGRGRIMLEPGRRWEWTVSLLLGSVARRPALSKPAVQRVPAGLGAGQMTAKPR